MEAVFRDLRKLYRQIGAEEHIQYVSVPTPHGFWAEARRELYRFINKWFDRQDAGVDEPAVTPEKESDLFCAPGGQVRNLPNAQTVYSLNRRLMADLRESRQNRRDELPADEYHDSIRQGILQATLYRPNRGPPRLHSLESTSNDSGNSPHRMIVEYDAGFHSIAEKACRIRAARRCLLEDA